jgi:hypothetical protein
VSEDRIPTFRDAVRHWKRKEVPRLDGKLGLEIGERSSHTMGTIQFEWPHAKQLLRAAGEHARENPNALDYPLLVQEMRERSPGLEMISDVGLTDLINQANKDGKLAVREIYAREVEYFTKGEVSAETTKIYCKPSHKSRQRKQTTRGRPRKNRS